MTLQEQLTLQLLEDNRTSLISQSRNQGVYKDQSRGKNRFERKKYSKLANAVKNYNKINMNLLFKQDILQVDIPIVGENNEYTVTVKIEGVIAELQKNIKNNNNKLEFRSIIQALSKVFNTTDIYTKCTCLTADTKIPLLDGTTPSITELKSRFESGEQLYCYSVDKHGDFKPGIISNVFKSGETQKLYKITLDNGKSITTTADHLYMLRNGNFKSAENLSINDSLMPLYFNKTKNGYKTVKLNSTGHYHSVYKLVADYFKSDEISKKTLQASKEQQEGKDPMRYKVAIHHVDFNKDNNNPNNLQILTGYEHWLYHAATIKRLWDNPEFVKATKERGRRWMTYLNQHPTEKMLLARKDPKNIKNFLAHNYDPVWLEKQSKLMSAISKNYWQTLTEEQLVARKKQISEQTKLAWENGHFDTEAFRAAAIQRGIDMHTPEREQLAKIGVQRYWANLSDSERAARKAQLQKNLAKGIGWNKGKKLTEEDRAKKSLAALNRSPEEKKLHTQKIRDTKILKVFKKMLENGENLTEEIYESYRTKYFPKSPHLNKFFNSIEEAVSYFELNHKIVNIKIVEPGSPEAVYDITVDNYHNFLVDSGVILHNCSDFKYRFAHWHILKNVSVDDSSKDPGPGKGIANPNDDMGRGCKHILLALANGDWMMKVASVINNYCHYASEKMPEAFLKLIFPKLYGVPADEAVDNDIIANIEDLETGSDLIDIINDYGKNRGKFKKGSNVNPVYADKLSKEQATKETEEEPTQPTKAPENSEEDEEDSENKT